MHRVEYGRRSTCSARGCNPLPAVSGPPPARGIHARAADLALCRTRSILLAHIGAAAHTSAMARSQSKYSDEQREGILRAVHDRGLTAELAVELAASGSLEADLDPFTMPAATARTLIARAAREGSRAEMLALHRVDPAAVDKAIHDAFDAIDQEITRIKDNGQKRELTVDELQRLRWTVKVAREVCELAKALPPMGSKTPAPTPQAESSLVRDMREEIEREEAMATNGTGA